MAKMNIIENDHAIVNIDLMAALIIVMSIIAVAMYSVPTVSYNDKDWRAKQYIYTIRVTDSMVQNEGDSLWEVNWTSGNYSGVKKIGFLYINNNKPENKVLNIEKIKALMGNGYKDNYTYTTWWEFPSPDNNLTTVNNASRSLGLTGYSFYIQLHPVGLNNFDPIPLETNISSKNINFDIATVVDRYVYIVDPSISDDIKYLKYDNMAVHYRLNLWVW